MKLLYVMSHPSDRLDDERAGHVVRPRQLLAGLRALGHTTSVVEAAAGTASSVAVGSYSRIKGRVPAAVALPLRDAARVVQNERFGRLVLDRVVEQAPDVVLETQVAFSTVSAVVAQRSGVPLVLDDVSPVTEDEHTYDVRLRRLARSRRRRALQAASIVVVTSSSLRQELLAEGVPEHKLAVLPNAVPERSLRPDPRAAELRQQLGFREQDVVVGYLGSFQPFHRTPLLIRALADPQVPAQVRVLAVGDGDERAAAERLATELGVRERIVFVGRVPSDDVGAYVQAADLTVLPATATYTNPMKLYDYVAAGRPVIAPRQRAVLDVLGEEPVEYFEADSVTGLAAAIAHLATDDQARAVRGRAATAAAGQHTWLRRAETLAALVAELPPRPLVTTSRSGSRQAQAGRS